MTIDQGVQEELIQQIIAGVGGKKNIKLVTHCVTRLRFILHDESLVSKSLIESLDLVKGTFLINGQFQIIIGQGKVDSIHDALIAYSGLSQSSGTDVATAAEQQMNLIQRMVKLLADIFIPLLPAIVTAGLLMGLNNLLTEKIFANHQSLVDMFPQFAAIASIIQLIASTAFVFLPGLVGWSAVKRFGGNPLLGIVLGLMLIHPDLLNAWGYAAAKLKGDIPAWHLFGLTIEKVGYQGQVLPVLVAAYVMVKIESWLNKCIPDAFKLLIVAPVTLLVTGFLAFIVIGPITFALANGLTFGLVFIFTKFALVGGLVFGALYAPIVITGMHQSFLAIDFQLIASTGGALIWPMVALSNIAQGSATLAMMVIAPDEKIKGLALTSAISAYLGITEPAMFGVNLRFKVPFFCAIVGAALGSALIAVNHVTASAIGVGGLPAFLTIFPKYWLVYFMAMAIVVVIPFLLTLIFAKKIKWTGN